LRFLTPASDDREDSAGSHRLAIDRQADILIRGSSYLATSDVSRFTRAGTSYLQGRVPSQYLNQVAQKIAVGVEWLRQILNAIEVIARPDRPSLAAGPIRKS